MTRELRDVLFTIDTERFVEAHSNFLIEDEDLLNAVDQGMIDADFVDIYAGVLSRMEEGTLTDEDQYMIYESFRSGEMDDSSYSALVESGLIDMDMTKEFLLEDFLCEADTAPVANNAAQQAKPALPVPVNKPTAQGGKSKGLWDSVKQVGNNVAGHAARGVGYVASKMGNHKFAAKAYGFAAKRFDNAGNKNQAMKAKTNYSTQHKVGNIKANMQKQTQAKIDAATKSKANQPQAPAANDPANKQQQTKEGLDYSLLHTLDVSKLV